MKEKMKASIEHKKRVIAQSKERLGVKSNHLKKIKLNAIMSETAKEEEFLTEKSAEYQALIEDRLLTAYKRIRSSVRNGLAVVSIEERASGSFFTIPPQTQVEIASRKKSSLMNTQGEY
jgi:predicted  nucleic acid-binding Zn-ribbon protein